MPFKAKKAVFMKLEEIVDIASLSKEDRMKYDEAIKVVTTSSPRRTRGTKAALRVAQKVARKAVQRKSWIMHVI